MQPRRIAIVDDEIIIARDLETRLVTLGYSVVGIASTGHEAIQLALETVPDLMLMDIVLKGDMDGVEAAGHIRDQQRIPVIYLTAYTDRATLDRARVTEPYGYIVKPFAERELHASIQMALYRHAAEDRVQRMERWFAAAVDEVADAVVAADPQGVITLFNPAAEIITDWRRDDAVGLRLDEVLRLVDRRTGAPVDLSGAADGPVVCLGTETLLLDRLERSVPVDSTTSAVRGDRGQVAGTVTVFRDVSGQRHGSLAALNADIAVATAQPLSLQGMLQLCADSILRHLSAAFVAFWTSAHRDGELVMVASAGANQTNPNSPRERVRIGEFTIGRVAQERVPYITNDLFGDPRLRDPDWVRAERLVSFAGYPLMADDRLVGVMALCARRPPHGHGHGRASLHLRHHRRGDRPQEAGRAAAPGAEDGGHRPAGRGRGARLQQPAHHHLRLLPAPAGVGRAGRRAARADHGHRRGGRAGRRAHPAAAGVQPQAGAGAAAAEPERAGGGGGKDAAPADRRRRRAPHRARRHPAARDGRSRAGGAGDHEPGGERPRRHAPRRAAHHRNGQRRGGRDLRAHPPHRPRGTVRAAGGERHRVGDGARGARPRLRALFHHQGPGPGDGAGALDGPRHRAAERGARGRVQRGGAGNGVQGLPSLRRRCHRSPRAPRRRCVRAAARDRDGAGGRGRSGRPAPDLPRAAHLRVRGARGGEWRRGAPRGRGFRGDHRPAVDGRGDARHGRPGARRDPDPAAAGAARAVRVGVRRRRRDPARGAGGGHVVSAEAVHALRTGQEGARGSRAPLKPDRRPFPESTLDPRTLHAACILAVDDEQANLDLLRHLLLRDGFVDVRGTTSPREALALFHSLRPDLVVLDLHMPEMGGMELLGALAPTLAERGFLPVLVVSGDLSQPARQQALARGAKDFLAKPYDPGEALLRIRNLLEMRFLHQEVLRHNDELERRVAERTAELEIAHQEVIDRLGRAAEFRDDDTGEHTRRVGVLSGRIAARLGGMGPAWVRRLTRAAALHDVGKIAVPDAILRKPGPLTDDERTVMRTHALLGAQLLSGGRSETLQMAERIAAAHHERWDGAGYPLGLAADQIPLEARIVAVADFFDALSYARPYRGPVPPAEVLKMITDGAGTHFDPEVVAAFLELAVASAPPP